MSTAWFADVHVTDVGRVDAQLPQAVHLDHVPTAPFTFHSHRVTRDPLDVEETRGTDGIHLRLPERRSYQVGLPVRGPLHADHRGEELDLGPGRAAVFSPSPETTVVTDEGVAMAQRRHRHRSRRTRSGEVLFHDLLELAERFKTASGSRALRDPGR
jgi:hypothetical protein